MSSPAFTNLADLASARVGGRAIATNDDFFAPKANLVKPEPAIFVPGKFTPKGKWMDGWESRRRRTPGHDWCVIQLGLRGVIKHVDIDTNHFLGNHPPFASLDTLSAGEPVPADASKVEKMAWVPILSQSPLNPGSQNLFDVKVEGAWTHVRLN